MFTRARTTAPQRFAVVVLGLGLLDAARTASPAEFAGPEDAAAVRHLLSRATFGVRAEDLDLVLDMGIEAWLNEQLNPERIDDSALAQRLAAFPAATMDQRELYERFPSPQALQRELKRTSKAGRDSAAFDPEAIKRLRRALGVKTPGRILFDLAGAKLQRAVYSRRQLEEVMTDFWFNHFNVFFGKAADRWLIGEYEREAIRPHVFGTFEDMLVATAQHPAMLFYLDNWRNVAPDSLRSPDLGLERLRRLSTAQRRGINENYARELLELHTLGVDGGYGQDDVVEVARVFTGWGITHPRRGQPGPITFSYQSRLHDPTDKWVLGEPVQGRTGSGGMQEGWDVLARLAVHPSTAHHIATELAVAFVADDPPEALVDDLTQVFLDTGGDLRAVTYALFTSQGFQDPDVYGAKLKTPFELVASALRATDARVRPSRTLVKALEEMGELPYLAQPPTGYPDEGEDWSNSGALLQRVNFAVALAAGTIRGVRVPVPESVNDVFDTLFPGADVDALRVAITGELAEAGTPEGEVARRTLGLALGSPEFQTR